MSPWLTDDAKAVLEHFGWPEWEEVDHWSDETVPFQLRMDEDQNLKGKEIYLFSRWVGYPKAGWEEDGVLPDHEATCLLNEWARGKLKRWSSRRGYDIRFSWDGTESCVVIEDIGAGKVVVSVCAATDESALIAALKALMEQRP